MYIKFFQSTPYGYPLNYISISYSYQFQYPYMLFQLLGFSISGMFLCFEVDSYGHFFRKAKTRVLESAEPNWNQDFIIELEGSQTLRILCYEETETEGNKLRGKAQVDVSW